MTSLYKLWNNYGECLLKFATDDECKSCMESELKRDANMKFWREQQCTQEEFDAMLKRECENDSRNV